MRNHRSEKIFWICILAAGALLAQMTLYMLEVLFRWDLPVNVFDICHSLVGSIGLPFTSLLLDGLIMSTFAVCLWHIGKQTVLYRRAKRKFERLTEHRLTRKLDRRYTGGKGKLVVIEHEQVVALTMGFCRPRIVLSTGLIRLLDDSELEAVIRHEEHHLLHMDPLRTLLTYLSAKVMWYLPILKWCHHVCKISREVLADRYAIERTGSAQGLGGALLKLVKAKPVNIPFAHASFLDTSINARILHLVEPQSEVPFRMPWKAALVSLHVSLFLTGLILPMPL